MNAMYAASADLVGEEGLPERQVHQHTAESADGAGDPDQRAGMPLRTWPSTTVGSAPLMISVPDLDRKIAGIIL